MFVNIKGAVAPIGIPARLKARNDIPKKGWMSPSRLRDRSIWFNEKYIGNYSLVSSWTMC